MDDLHFDILSLNVRGLGDHAKRRKIFNYAKKHVSHKGVIFLQETHSVQKDEQVWTNQFGCDTGSVFFSHGKSDSRGVLIAFREGIKYNVIEKYIDTEGHYIVLNLLLNNSPVVLINYCAPNQEAEQLKVLDRLTHILDQLDIAQDTMFMWGGDFNMIFDIDLDADGGSPKLYIKPVSKLLSVMSEIDLCDIYRVRNPDSRRLTWRRKSPFKQRRLGFFLVSDCLQDNIESVEIIPSVGTDHSCLLMKLRPTYQDARGRSYWKFNNLLTQDRHFVNFLKSKIPLFERESSFEDQISKWEFIKYKCREACRTYSIQKSKERRARRVELEKKLADLEQLLRTNNTENISEEYDISKSELDQLYDYITAGIIMRSKSSWYEHGEKSSKYFLNLEKRNKAKSHVRSLISESGIQVNDPTEIMSKVRDFYSNLYTRRSTKTEKECLDYLSRFQIPRLSKTDRDSCEGMLTKKECWRALNAMKNGKSPGNDGLTKEFYVCFFNEISDSLVAALNR